MDLPKAIFVLFVLFKIFFEIGAIVMDSVLGMNYQVASLLLKKPIYTDEKAEVHSGFLIFRIFVSI